MTEHAQTYEMVEVKAEDIMGERSSFYEAFLKVSNWAIGLTIAVLVLMAIFLV